MSQSWRKLIENVYGYRWSRWQGWCAEHSVDGLHPSSSELASFLAFLSDKDNLSVSTVKGYRSAISTTIQQRGRPDLSNSHLLHLQDVAWALLLSEAQRPRRNPSWDLFVVLDTLRLPPFEPLHLVSFKLWPIRRRRNRHLFLLGQVLGKIQADYFLAYMFFCNLFIKMQRCHRKTLCR